MWRKICSVSLLQDVSQREEYRLGEFDRRIWLLWFSILEVLVRLEDLIWQDIPKIFDALCLQREPEGLGRASRMEESESGLNGATKAWID